MKRLRCTFVGLLTVAALASGCGGGDDDSPFSGETIPPLDLTDETTTSAPGTTGEGESPVTTAPPESSGPDLDTANVASVIEGAAPGEVEALVRAIPVDQTVYYAGFAVTVDEVLFGFDSAGFAVAEVRTTATNNTGDADRIKTAVEIESQGTVTGIDREMNSGDIPTGSSGPENFSIRLDATTFEFDDALLHIGRGDRQRAQIPLGSSGELIDRAPIVQHDVGEASDDVQSIDLTEMRLRWDLANPRSQASPGEAYVEVDYVLDSSVATSVSGGTIVLDLPDGSTAEAISQTATIASVDADVATELSAAFLVVDPFAGDYVLRYIERFGNGEVEVPFTIES